VELTSFGKQSINFKRCFTQLEMEEVVITFRGAERDEIEFRDIVNFLWDLNLVYEISRLAVDPRYRGVRITRQVFQRNGRPLYSEDRLRLIELSKESPLKLKLAIAAVPAAAAALWAIVQTAQTIENWPLQRAKLEAEVLKTQLEVKKLYEEQHPPMLIVPDELKQLPMKSGAAIRPPRQTIISTPKPQTELKKFERRVARRDASAELEAVNNRLARSPVRIEDVEIEIVTEDNEPRR
jgi:hypothetical protein